MPRRVVPNQRIFEGVGRDENGGGGWGLGRKAGPNSARGDAGRSLSRVMESRWKPRGAVSVGEGRRGLRPRVWDIITDPEVRGTRRSTAGQTQTG